MVQCGADLTRGLAAVHRLGAIVRIEGSPTKKPSFWARKILIVKSNTRVGPFWLTNSNKSKVDVWVFGPTEIKIGYLDYQVNRPSGKVMAEQSWRGTE